MVMASPRASPAKAPPRASPMASPRASIADGNDDEQRPRQTRTQYKWLLLICWLFVLAQIWFASDGSDEVMMDPSFGEPEREARHRPDGNNYDIAWEPGRTPEREMGGIDEYQGGNEKIDSVEAKDADEDGVMQDQNGFESTLEAEDDDENDSPEDILKKIAKLSINETSAHQSKILVEALQPITSKKCCVPAVYNETSNPKDVACFGTCFNERACNDPLYPFNSEEEKEMFSMADPSPEGKRNLRQECKSPKKLVPPVKWCQKPHADTENATAAHLVDGIPPAGCSTITPGGGSGAFQHVIIFPEAKLAFCGIPKVGITQWEQFLRFYFGAKDYPALPHYKLDRNPFQFDKLDPQVQRRIWEDEEWTWAAFIRNPAERLLSAYLDKVKSKKEFKQMNSSMPFEDFINALSQQSNSTNCENKKGDVAGLNWCSDPHWRPQVYSCGLSERLDRFQFIGDLEHAGDHTRELLSNVGLWESHGKHYINGGVKSGFNPWCHIASHPANHTVHVGFQQKNEMNNASAADTVYGHSKGSKGKMEEYLTPELLEKVQEELYADDYKLWKLVNANGQKLSKGKELAPQLSRQCAKIPIGAIYA